MTHKLIYPIYISKVFIFFIKNELSVLSLSKECGIIAQNCFTSNSETYTLYIEIKNSFNNTLASLSNCSN